MSFIINSITIVSESESRLWRSSLFFVWQVSIVFWIMSNAVLSILVLKIQSGCIVLATSVHILKGKYAKVIFINGEKLVARSRSLFIIS